jgi:hypothetical protein
MDQVRRIKSKWNLLGTMFEHAVVQNDTGSDITLLVGPASDDFPQVIHMPYHRGTQQRVSLLPDSYLTVLAPMPYGSDTFVIASNVAIKVGRLYTVSRDDYDVGLEIFVGKEK